MSTGFNPYYQGSSGITAKISGGRLIDSPTIGDLTAGASYYFDGTDDKVQVADADALSIIEQGTDGSWAVEVFFRADDGAASSDRLVSKGTAEYSFGLADCSIDGSTITYPTAMDNSSYADQWMHLMLVGNGSLMEQFINGVSQGTTDCTASGVTGSADLRFGLETDDSGDFNGEIGRVRLFNDALTDDEVRILYNGGAVPQDRQDELVGEWLSSGVTAGAWIESSGNNFTGEATGATAINEKANILRTDQNLVADLQSGASFSFDGTDDKVVVSDNDNLDVGTDDFSISAWVKTSTNISSWQNIASKRENSASPIGYEFAVKDGKLKAMIADVWTSGNVEFQGATTLTDGEWHHVVGIWDRDGNGYFYLDGVADGTPVSIAGSPGSLDNTNSFRIGIGRGDYGYFNGQISQVRLHNRALSAAEVRAAYNGQAVPFEYVGGKQDELVTNGDMASSGSWTVQTNWAIGSGVATATNAVGNYIYQDSVFEGGKAYRVKLDWTRTDGEVEVRYLDSAATAYVNIKEITSGSSGSIDEVITTTSSVDGTLYIMGGTSFDGTIDNVSVTQIGCVAEYLPSGVGHNQWSDSSGNGLDGAVSGATAVNAPDVQRVKLAGVTGDTQKDNFIPAGYVIQDVITAETAGNEVSGFNVGFGADDGTIVADVTVTASTTTSQTIAASVATLAADDTIYISATPTTGWNSGSVDIYFTLRRVA